MVMPGCKEKVTCAKKIDGSLEARYIDYLMPPNSVCTTDSPPKIVCARGFKMGADGKRCESKKPECT